MRVTCPHCGGKAIVYSRNTHTPTASDLYCQCRNPLGCGATFVYTLALKHTLNPPVAVTAQLALAVRRALPEGGAG
jgi:ribosomal protein S27E